MGKEDQVVIRFVSHPPEDKWEEYAFGRLPESQMDRLEDHLLACTSCQSILEYVDTIIHSMRSEFSQAVLMPPSKEDSRNPSTAVESLEAAGR